MTTIYFATNHATIIPLMQDAYRGEVELPLGYIDTRNQGNALPADVLVHGQRRTDGQRDAGQGEGLRALALARDIQEPNNLSRPDRLTRRRRDRRLGRRRRRRRPSAPRHRPHPSSCAGSPATSTRALWI